MSLTAEIFVSGSICLLSTGLFVYWSMRALLIVTGTEARIHHVLDCDSRWGRRF